MNEEKLKKHWNPRGDIHGHEENSTQLLLAELDLLRKSTLFLGSLHSNLGRALTYLRYQHIDNTIPLLPQMSIWRLDQLPFYF